MEEDILLNFLIQEQGYSENLAKKAVGKMDKWRQVPLREKSLKIAVVKMLPEQYQDQIDELMDMIKAQSEY